MHCKNVQDYLERYNEGFPDGVLRSAIEKHLQECSGCRKIYENSKVLRQFIKGCPLPAMPRDTGAVILAAAVDLLNKQKDKNKSPLFQKWKMKAAMSMRSAFVGILSALFLPVKGEVQMKKLGYGFKAVLLGLVLAGVTAFFVRTHFFSNRVVLSDNIKEEREILHNADGHHACHCFSPLISYFEISNITATSATFTWDCSSPSSYQVNYGLTSAKGTLYPAETPTVSYSEHSVTVTGLEPNTTYHAGPSSICLSNCTRNREAGLVKQWLMTDKSKSDWTFTTQQAAVSVLDENKIASGAAACAISDMQIKKITGNDVTIVWKTNIPASSLIEYGLTKEYGMQSGTNMEMVRNHDIQLFNLQKDTTYYCRAASYTAGSADPVYSQTVTFKTPAVEERIVNKKNIYNEPNPCSDWTVFSYFCYQPVKRVTIDVMTLSGKLVASLESPSSALAEGWNKVRWDVRDNSGKALSNGVYIYLMKFQTGNNFVEEVKSSGLRIVR